MADEPDVAGWDTWRREVFGDPYLVWHDGADFRRLADLAERDLPAVDRRLVAGLRDQDPLAARSIEFLARSGRTPEHATALLPDAAAVADGEFLIRVAEALHTLTGNESWAEPIAAELASDSSWSIRQHAAMSLVAFAPNAHLVQALGKAVCDEEYLVRHSATNTLLQYAGRRTVIERVPEIWAKITGPHQDESSGGDRARWREAATELTAAVPLDDAT